MFAKPIGLVVLALVQTCLPAGRCGAEPRTAPTAADVLDESGWRYVPTKKLPGRTRSHLIWGGLKHPTSTTFASSDGSFNNIGSYDEAFEYYATKCGMKPGFRLPLDKHEVGTSTAGDYVIETYGTKKRRNARFTLQSATTTVRVTLEETATTDEDGVYSISVFLTLGGTDTAKRGGD